MTDLIQKYLPDILDWKTVEVKEETPALSRKAAKFLVRHLNTKYPKLRATSIQVNSKDVVLDAPKVFLNRCRGGVSDEETRDEIAKAIELEGL